MLFIFPRMQQPFISVRLRFSPQVKGNLGVDMVAQHATRHELIAITWKILSMFGWTVFLYSKHDFEHTMDIVNMVGVHVQDVMHV